MKLLKTTIIILLSSLLMSCAEPKTFTDNNGKKFTAVPYGIGNETSVKLDTVVYQISSGNVIWSIIGCETIVVPVVLVGYQLWEPVRLKDKNGK